MDVNKFDITRETSFIIALDYFQAYLLKHCSRPLQFKNHVLKLGFVGRLDLLEECIDEDLINFFIPSTFILVLDK
jgi:hypothetical protein